MKIRDPHDFRGGLNVDDSPSNLPPGDYVGSLNARTLSSDEQHGAGVWETLQGEIEILLGVEAPSYYGGAIGGEFIYYGFDEFTVGNQTWMKKNYDVDYPGSKAYSNVENNVSIYGRLYTHGQAMSADFCPPGWRVPTEADIDELLTFLGGEMLAGGKMKEVGDSHWTDPNTGADDSSGFRAVPGGKFDLLFDLLGENCILWLQDDAGPPAPVALNGSEITGVTFMANWKAVTGASGYYLDVATDAAFTAMVAGFDNLDAGNVLFKEVTGLSGETDYFFRVRAYNEIGASNNSNTINLTTEATPPLLTEIVIGAQTWALENISLTITGSKVYDNLEANRAIYGGLYNYAMLAEIEASYPGWHIPTKAEWLILQTSAGGAYWGGMHLKEAGLVHWDTPNDLLAGGPADNSTGFTALGAGYTDASAWSFLYLKEETFFRTSTISVPTLAETFVVGKGNTQILNQNLPQSDYLSVRLIKD